MSKRSHWDTSNDYLKALVLPLLIFFFLIAFLYVGADRTSQTAESEGRKVLEDAVQRATIQCYAIEGMYPPEIAYLEDEYGLVVDTDKYIIHYEVFASNILPTIIVIDK